MRRKARGLTVQETAQITKFAPETVRYWLRVGILRGIRCGDDWLVAPADLLAFFQENNELLPWDLISTEQFTPALCPANAS